MQPIHRGDVYIADLSAGIGSEQYGERPVLVIQNDIGNKYSPTVIVAAITTKHNKAKIPTHVMVEDEFMLPSLVMLEQLRTIDKKRLGKYLCHLSQDYMEKIETALAVSVGLK